ncbi:hypothetical protein NKH36_12650 [Mesorhizobium sp. M1312]|uniref:hypothetical protein n=1 Tax=Mesorhizobium sp. M1312 TaxID=2957080 RepID=UPI0033357904
MRGALGVPQGGRRAAYPKQAALRRRIESDPDVRYAQAIEDGEKPAGSGACLGHIPLAESD